jgi:hypothetical protein
MKSLYSSHGVDILFMKLHMMMRIPQNIIYIISLLRDYIEYLDILYNGYPKMSIGGLRSASLY